MSFLSIGVHMPNTILLAGCGNMGFAMLKGWLSRNTDLAAFVVEPADALRARAADTGATAVASVSELPDDLQSDMIFLAVKPQVMRDVLPDYVTVRPSLWRQSAPAEDLRLIPGPAVLASASFWGDK